MNKKDRKHYVFKCNHNDSGLHVLFFSMIRERKEHETRMRTRLEEYYPDNAVINRIKDALHQDQTIR